MAKTPCCPAPALAMLLGAAILLTACTTAPTSSLPSDASASSGPASVGAPGPAASANAPMVPTEGANAPDLPSASTLEEFERGQASWYGPRFHGRRTASGERYDQREYTAAHKTLPFGTRVRVRSLVSGKEITVRVNDRGPFVRGRVIDVSKAAAEALGMMVLGVKPVSLHLADAGAVSGASPAQGLVRSDSLSPAAWSDPVDFSR